MVPTLPPLTTVNQFSQPPLLAIIRLVTLAHMKPYMSKNIININIQDGESGELCGAPLANWVTVWGFPPSAASFILQQVSSLLH